MKKGFLYNPFFSSNDVLIFPSKIVFEEWIYGYNCGHNIREVPLHTLVVTLNFFYKYKVNISLCLRKETRWAFIETAFKFKGH